MKLSRNCPISIVISAVQSLKNNAGHSPSIWASVIPVFKMGILSTVENEVRIAMGSRGPKKHTPGPRGEHHVLQLDSKNSLIAKNTLLTQACLHPLIFYFTCKIYVFPFALARVLLFEGKVWEVLQRFSGRQGIGYSFSLWKELSSSFKEKCLGSACYCNL